MAKKKKPDAPDVAEPNYTDGEKAGKTAKVLIWSHGDVLTEYLHDEPKVREFTIGGQPYDHSGTAPDGTWIYRNDRKN